MAGRAISLDLNLPQLQNLIKRDAESYKDEFTRQYRHFESSFEIFKLQPTADSKLFCDLVMFIANVAYCYPKDVAQLPSLLMDLIRSQTVLNPEVRRTIVQALMQLRAKNMIDQITILSLFFSLLRTRDKQLRAQLRVYIESDIKKANLNAKNNRLNKAIQNHIFSLVSGDLESGEGSDTAAMIAVNICQDLYKKQIWNDSKTVSIISHALFSPFNKVMVSALKFFLGRNEEADKDSDDEDDVDINKVQFRSKITKKSRAAQHKLEKAIKQVKRKEKKSKQAEEFNFSALHLLNDPQGLAEKLFKRMTSKSDKMVDGKMERELKFEIKLMFMNLISRIIGIHKLILLNFYPFTVRYLKPNQQDVTQVMAALAQASHDLVPPDALEEIIRTIVDGFVSDAYAGEVIAAGINAAREIAKRCPLSMDSEILAYLVTFKTHRDKGVNIAAKSIIGLFREIAPEMLPKKDRGKAGAMEVQRGGIKKRIYGQTDVADGVFDPDLLEELGSDSDDQEGWDLNGDESGEDQEGWVNVSSGDEEKNPIPEDLVSGKKEKYKIFYGFNMDKKNLNKEEEEEGGELEVAEEDDDELEGVEETEGDEIDEELASDFEEEVDQEEDQEEDEELEEVEEEGQVEPKPTADKKRVDMMRILTPADFEKLKALKLKKQAEEIANPTGKKRAREEQDDEEDVHNIVTLNTIEGYHRKKKATKEERIASIMEGRKDRPKFGSKKGSKDRGSLTNRENAKNKNFMMIVHKSSVVAKKKMSMRDKQMRKRKHIDHAKKQI